MFVFTDFIVFTDWSLLKQLQGDCCACCTRFWSGLDWRQSGQWRATARPFRVMMTIFSTFYWLVTDLVNRLEGKRVLVFCFVFSKTSPVCFVSWYCYCLNFTTIDIYILNAHVNAENKKSQLFGAATLERVGRGSIGYRGESSLKVESLQSNYPPGVGFARIWISVL